MLSRRFGCGLSLRRRSLQSNLDASKAAQAFLPSCEFRFARPASFAGHHNSEIRKATESGDHPFPLDFREGSASQIQRVDVRSHARRPQSAQQRFQELRRRRRRTSQRRAREGVEADDPEAVLRELRRGAVEGLGPASCPERLHQRQVKEQAAWCNLGRQLQQRASPGVEAPLRLPPLLEEGGRARAARQGRRRGRREAGGRAGRRRRRLTCPVEPAFFRRQRAPKSPPKYVGGHELGLDRLLDGSRPCQELQALLHFLLGHAHGAPQRGYPGRDTLDEGHAFCVFRC
mmetsp:Transcript_3598/g.13191  ORF Transcript_3598/g.13191 Transcript_3598/m.13191 type:complete len:288 (+) Transcript_3598:55-918(+)